MCFYYSITKKSINKLVKGKLIKESQLSLFEEHYIVNGFDHPRMPVITDDRPNDIQQFQWGFLPGTVDDSKAFLGKYNTLNAKAEEAENSRLYSESLNQRRCLVLCSGFFEWKQVKKEKIPYYITLKDDEMFVFAGIWNNTTESKGNTIQSFSILTIGANELMAEIHNSKKRMPLILNPETARLWLKPNLSINELKELLKPLSSSEMKAHTIKKFIPSEAKNINISDIIAYYHYPVAQDVLTKSNTLF
jgi:putative SOS response-associated peptidase YedK